MSHHLDPSRLALVFPGQGSQSIGMMNGFADMPVVQRTFTEASDLLHIDLWKLAAEGPNEALAQTVITQPIMFAAGVATFRVWQELHGPAAAVYAGHSLGEYTALVAAGAISFGEAVPLVRFRAEAMQDAVPEGVGGIAAVLGLDESLVDAVCAQAAQGEVCEPVNLNSPGQVVIAGHRGAVERGMALAKERGAKRAIMLPMSVPAHCSLMKPAAERFAVHLDDVHFAVPAVPVIQNAEVQSYTSAADIKHALVRQLYHPVRWIETIHAVAQRGVSDVLECGPGKVLTSLNKRIDAHLHCMALHDTASIRAALAK